MRTLPMNLLPTLLRSVRCFLLLIICSLMLVSSLQAKTSFIETWFKAQADKRPELPEMYLKMQGFDKKRYAELKKSFWKSYRKNGKNLYPGEFKIAPQTKANFEKQIKKSRASKKPLKIQTSVLPLKNDRSMPYGLFTKGKKPKNGWPLFISMHGGGRSSVKQKNPHGWGVNSQEWQTQFQLFYKIYPENAMYFIPRMVDDNLGRWHHAFNYEAFDKVIRQAIVNYEVDPNRVYMMGISEGGYGTDLLSTFMPDRLAAADSMAAGSGTEGLENLRNLPFRLDSGEHDTMYGRSKLVAKCRDRFKELQTADPAGYVHKIAVQKGRGHGINYKPGPAWAYQFTRNPYPTKLVWIPRNIHPATYPTDHYWLSLDKEKKGKLYLTAEADRKTNSIKITAEQPLRGEDNKETGRTPLVGRTITVYLHDRLLNLDKPITLNVNGKESTHTVKRSAETMLNSIINRGDPEYVFPAKIEIKL